MDEHHAAGEFRVKLFGWSQERRFVVVRERIREPVAKRLEAIEIEIDKAAAELWKITAAELAEIKFSLADLQ